MDIKDLLSKLDVRVKKMRSYNASEDDGGAGYEAEEYAGHLLEQQDCLGHKPVFKKKSYRFSDISLLGPGAQPELAEKLGIPLPEDYLLFCRRFNNYLFVGGSAINLYEASFIEHFIDILRTYGESRGSYRLFPFAGVMGSNAFFSFRWSEDYSKMDVVFGWNHGDIGEAALLGPEGDRFHSDADFTSWLARMIETEGVPIFHSDQWPMSDGEWYEDDMYYKKEQD